MIPFYIEINFLLQDQLRLSMRKSSEVSRGLSLTFNQLLSVPMVNVLAYRQYKQTIKPDSDRLLPQITRIACLLYQMDPQF